MVLTRLQEDFIPFNVRCCKVVSIVQCHCGVSSTYLFQILTFNVLTCFISFNDSECKVHRTIGN